MTDHFSRDSSGALSHAQVWDAIDALAQRNDMTPSALAKKAGLDATTFNKSKRSSVDGRLRWPSTESIAKVLDATGSTLTDFLGVMSARAEPKRVNIPLIGLAQAGAGGYFTDGGYPVGSGWDEVNFPNIADDHSYALEISGDSMLPVYRDGDTIIVSPGAAARRSGRGEDVGWRGSGQGTEAPHGPHHRVALSQPGARGSGPAGRAGRLDRPDRLV